MPLNRWLIMLALLWPLATLPQAELRRFFEQTTLLRDNGGVVSWGWNRRELKALHDRQDWAGLGEKVVELDYAEDLAYLYLAKSAENLGYRQAALEYFQRALRARKCAGVMFNNCDGFNVAQTAGQAIERLTVAEARERERVPTQVQAAAPATRPEVALRPERRVALVVGNATYKVSPLDNPTNDAEDVDEGLRNAGFQTTLLRNASLREMREATRRFADQLATADVALIYFAGHGIESKGRNYMIPVDADLKFEYELADQAYDASNWLEMLEAMRSANADRVNIVILDACRNNSLVGARSMGRGLGRMDAPSGTFLAYSTSPGKVAADGPRGQRNSPFTKHLVQAMQQPNLGIEEVFKEVRRNVSRDTGGVQIPWESTSLTGFFSFRRQP